MVERLDGWHDGRDASEEAGATPRRLLLAQLLRRGGADAHVGVERAGLPPAEPPLCTRALTRIRTRQVSTQVQRLLLEKTNNKTALLFNIKRSVIHRLAKCINAEV